MTTGPLLEQLDYGAPARRPQNDLAQCRFLARRRHGQYQRLSLRQGALLSTARTQARRPLQQGWVTPFGRRGSDLVNAGRAVYAVASSAESLGTETSDGRYALVTNPSLSIRFPLLLTRVMRYHVR